MRTVLCIFDAHNPEKLHATIVTSKTPIDTVRFDANPNAAVTIDGSAMRCSRFRVTARDKLLLEFDSPYILKRLGDAVAAGASAPPGMWRPHITLASNWRKGLPPPSALPHFPIVLEGEYYKPLRCSLRV